MTLFSEKEQEQENLWKDHFVGMPDYDNEKQKDPEITAMFKFRSKNDFDKFHAVIKEHLYNGKKVFDGMQKKEKKQAWFPLSQRPSTLRYIDGGSDEA